jgi:Uma2 family endonuclease
MTNLPPAKKRNPRIEDFHFPEGLPTADELPCSDGAPVDNELQELMPGLLKAVLMDIWREHRGWLFSIDMGFYYDPAHPRRAIALDGMLSLGLAKVPGDGFRLSYVLWQEKVLPLLAMEIVSPGRKNYKKFEVSQSVGILYYLVYSPWSEARFQLYKLIEGEYVLQSSGQEPYWMPEIGLAIGAERRLYARIEREWLYWYDENNFRYLTPTERANAMEAKRKESEDRRAEIELAGRIAAQQEIDILRERLRALGVDPDSIKS